MVTRSTRKKTEPTQVEESGLQSFASICTTLAVAVFIITFIGQNFLVPSASMASTILVGDHVLADTASLAPPSKWAPLPYRPLRRGEPVIFHKPIMQSFDGGEYLVLVKRVIGLPGDRIHLVHGTVYVNGIAQVEPYAVRTTAASYDPYRDDFPAHSGALISDVAATWALEMPEHVQNGELIVPPDCYFVMGDNRDNSIDSRYWGFVHRDNLIGRPLFVYWSFKTPDDHGNKTSATDQLAFAVHTALHFFDQTRWRRTLKPIR